MGGGDDKQPDDPNDGDKEEDDDDSGGGGDGKGSFIHESEPEEAGHVLEQPSQAGIRQGI